MAKKKSVKKPAIGAQAWLAVRQKSGAGPMEPAPRRGTRREREREAIARDDAPDGASE